MKAGGTQRRWPVAIAALSLIWLAAPAASAQPPADGQPSSDSQRAQELFDRGLADMLDEKYETGCPALAESYQLEPLPGALFTLAECEAKWGKLATALRHYREYANAFREMPPEEKKKQQERQEIAQQQVATLKERVPLLTVRAPAHLPEDAIVTLDGKPLGRRQLDSGQEVDPGPHEVAVEVPSTGYRKVYEVETGESVRESVQLEQPPLADEPPEADDGAGWSVRDWSYIVGGVGIAGVLVGTIAGAVTIGEKSTIEDNCVDDRCNREGIDAADTAETAGAVSTVGFIVGGAALAAATVMWIVGGEDDDEDAPAGESSGSAELGKLEPVLAPTVGSWNGVLVGVRGRW